MKILLLRKMLMMMKLKKSFNQLIKNFKMKFKNLKV